MIVQSARRPELCMQGGFASRLSKCILNIDILEVATRRNTRIGRQDGVQNAERWKFFMPKNCVCGLLSHIPVQRFLETVTRRQDHRRVSVPTVGGPKHFAEKDFASYYYLAFHSNESNLSVCYKNERSQEGGWTDYIRILISIRFRFMFKVQGDKDSSS